MKPLTKEQVRQFERIKGKIGVHWIGDLKTVTIEVRKLIRRTKNCDHFDTHLSNIYGSMKLWIPHSVIKARLVHQGVTPARIAVDLDWAMDKGLAYDAEIIDFTARRLGVRSFAIADCCL
jgi:hypothetical protein